MDDLVFQITSLDFSCHWTSAIDTTNHLYHTINSCRTRKKNIIKERHTSMRKKLLTYNYTDENQWLYFAFVYHYVSHANILQAFYKK